MKPSQALKKYQYWARACSLIAQLPEDNMDAAREVVGEFIEMADKAGLLRPRQSSLVVVGSFGNSPRRRANATDKSPIDPE